MNKLGLSHHSTTNLPLGFPKGLHVLVVDEEDKLHGIEAQLRQPELQYNVTCAQNAMEALELLRYATNGQGTRGQFCSNNLAVCVYDIILADSRVVAMEDSTGKAFIDACEDVPVVLMAEQGCPKDVLRSVKLGAVDFLDKPLSMLKLKNIWQHCVRKMMKHNSLVSYRDAGARPCYSAEAAVGGEVAGIPQHSSISGCVPSSMTAPMVPGASTGFVCTGIAGYAGAFGSVGNHLDHLGRNDSRYDSINNNAMHQVQQKGDINGNATKQSLIDSPQTPSGSDGDLAGETTSAVSAPNQQGGNRSGGSSQVSGGEEDGTADARSIRKKRHVKRHIAGKSQNVPMRASPNGQQWPPLDAGCTWGTPVGGSVLPPPLSNVQGKSGSLVGHKCQQQIHPWSTSFANPSKVDEWKQCHQSYLIKPSASNHSQDQSKSMGIEGEIESGEFFKNAGKAKCQGPLGLKLKKSDSLLDLINATLTHAH
jgi:CheY-like chemotaxis protein